MKVQTEISLYPLREDELTRPIQQFIQVLKSKDLNIEIGSMSTLITGEESVVFENLQKAFEKIAQKYEIVMTAKISNACPEVSKDKEALKNRK